MVTPSHLSLEDELIDDVSEVERIIGESVNPPFPEPEVLSDMDVGDDDSKDQETEKQGSMKTLSVETICGKDVIRTELKESVLNEKNDWLIDAYKHLKDQIGKADTFFQRENGKEYEWFYVKGKSIMLSGLKLLKQRF